VCQKKKGAVIPKKAEFIFKLVEVQKDGLFRTDSDSRVPEGNLSCLQS
jgi:hypothetical protein